MTDLSDKNVIMDDQTRRHVECVAFADMPTNHDRPNSADAAPVILGDPAYATLAGVLQAALDHAAVEKGHERHSDGQPFMQQPIMEIARLLGDTGGHSYQIMKKAQEANRMVKREQHDAAIHEYLGVINYAAAAILLIREL